MKIFKFLLTYKPFLTKLPFLGKNIKLIETNIIPLSNKNLNAKVENNINNTLKIWDKSIQKTNYDVVEEKQSLKPLGKISKIINIDNNLDNTTTAIIHENISGLMDFSKYKDLIDTDPTLKSSLAFYFTKFCFNMFTGYEAKTQKDIVLRFQEIIKYFIPNNSSSVYPVNHPTRISNVYAVYATFISFCFR